MFLPCWCKWEACPTVIFGLQAAVTAEFTVIIYLVTVFPLYCGWDWAQPFLILQMHLHIMEDLLTFLCQTELPNSAWNLAR